MTLTKIATSTIAAGVVGLAALGLGAGVASAAPQQHQQERNHGFQQPAPSRFAQQTTTITRNDYRAFSYRGVLVVPRYDAGRHSWGFDFRGHWVRIVLAHHR